MLNVTLLDNQTVTVTTNPSRAAGGPLVGQPVGFNVTNTNPGLVLITMIGGNGGLNPSFTIAPKIRFFGPDVPVTLTLQALTNLGGTPARLTETITVTVQGSEPDNGDLDHFAPVATPPVAQ